jgi:hypothetical protein
MLGFDHQNAVMGLALTCLRILRSHRTHRPLRRHQVEFHGNNSCCVATLSKPFEALWRPFPRVEQADDYGDRVLLVAWYSAVLTPPQLG